VASEAFDADLVVAARWDSFSLRLEDDGDNLGLVAPEMCARARLGWALGPVRLEFRAEIGVYGLPGKSASTLGEEISLGAGVFFADHVSVLIGYEYGRDRVRRKDSVQDNRMDLVFHGPCLRVEVRF